MKSNQFSNRNAGLVATGVLFVFLSAVAAIPVAADTTATSDPSAAWQVFSFVPPKPGVYISPEASAAHYKPYQAQRTPMAMQPLAFDWTHGDHKQITILAEFSDVPHSALGQTYYDDKWNYNGTARTSGRSFLYENSLGNYTSTATVTTWVTLPHTQAYYNSYSYRLVGDAATAADSQVDFTQFDENSDGWVDNLIIIHSGGDEAAGCGSACIWSHAGQGSWVYVEGGQKRVANYATIADFGYSGGSGDNLGVWIHEFGHLALNLPDFYEACAGNNDGLSVYEMMAGGSWSLNHFSAWPKEYLGWIDPYEPPFNVDGYTIYPAFDAARYNPVKITTNYTNEYFLVEMRYSSGSARYDTAIPYDGLMIFHVDANTMDTMGNCPEYYTDHKGVDIEEVGTQDLDVPGGGGYSNDMWVNNPTGFTPTSTPNSNLYVNNGNYATGIRVYNISSVLTNGGPHMTFNIDTGRINYGLYGRLIGAGAKETAPGTSATYPIEFSTLSAAGDTVSLQIEGVNQTQGSIDRTSLVLPPFGAAIVNLTVQIPAGWSAYQPAWVQVRGTSQNQPSVSFLVPTITTASQLYAVEVNQWSDFYARPGIDENRSFDVHNIGNGVDNVTVSASYDPAQIVVTVLTQPLLISRGASTAVPVQFNVPTTVAFGTDIPVRFDIRYGPFGSPIVFSFTAHITADRYALLSVDIASAVTNYLTPGQPRTFDVTVHNLGNYDSVFNLSANTPAGITATFDLPQIPVGRFSSGTIGLTLLAGWNTSAGTTGLAYATATYETGEDAAANSMTVLVAQRYELALTGDNAYSGRPGTHVQFTLSAINRGNGADPVDISFQPAFSTWNATVSATTLYLDTSVSNRSLTFEFMATIPTDAAGNLLQTFAVQIRSQGSGLTATLEVTVLVLPVYAFEVTADPAQGAISGSESASFLLTFRNRGNVRDSYSVTLDGIPEAWTTEFAQGGIATVVPKGTAQTTLIVRPSPGAASDRYDFQIFATSEGSLSRPITINLNVTILAHREIQLRAATVDGEVRPGATVVITFVVKNAGNVYETLYFEPQGPFARVDADPLQMTVPAFEERVVKVTAVVKNDQPAGAASLSITATATNDPTVTAEQTVVVTVSSVPTAPPTTPGLDGFAAVAALAAVAGLVAVAGRRRR